VNEIERQIFAATFAAAFWDTWKSSNDHQGVVEAINRVERGFQFAEVADLAVQSYREALSCADREYLLVVVEGWK
jgi:hypothetical protein